MRDGARALYPKLFSPRGLSTRSSSVGRDHEIADAQDDSRRGAASFNRIQRFSDGPSLWVTNLLAS
jgi:hypothetical protein